jgi:Transposase, Mutator family
MARQAHRCSWWTASGWPDHPVIQRCQLHKLRNVTDRLPDALAATVAKRMRAAYRIADPLLAEAELEALAHSLDRSHPGAAASFASTGTCTCPRPAGRTRSEDRHRCHTDQGGCRRVISIAPPPKFHGGRDISTPGSAAHFRARPLLSRQGSGPGELPEPEVRRQPGLNGSPVGQGPELLAGGKSDPVWRDPVPTGGAPA